MTPRAAKRLALFSTLAALGALAIVASPAFAFPGPITLSTTFGAATSTPPNPYPLTEPTAVAVDESTHDLYATDPANHWVEKFDSSGHLIWIIGREVNTHGTTAAEKDLCTAAEQCQAGASASTPGAFEKPTFIGVDNSAGASQGDVYVADSGDDLVSKFEADGTLVSSWGSAGQLNGSAAPAGPFGELEGVAVSASGNLLVLSNETRISTFQFDGTFAKEFDLAYPAAPLGFALDNSRGASSGDIYDRYVGGPETLKFSSTGEFLGESDHEEGQGFAVDSSKGDLYVDHGSAIFSYEASGAPLETFGSAEPKGGSLASALGLSVDASTGDVYVANSAAGNVTLFTPSTLPNVTPSSPTAVTAVSATLNARVDPDTAEGGGPIAACSFEYITDYEYTATEDRNSHTAEKTPPFTGAQQTTCHAEPPYTAPTEVATKLTGLSPGTEYHYRILVSNANGTNTVEGGTFTTSGRYIFSQHIAVPGSAAGQLSDPSDVAVSNLSGDLYVADAGNDRIDQFSSSGAFLRAWGWGVLNGAAESQVCTTSCQAGLPGSASGQFQTPASVEVDNSAGGEADVYVADAGGKVVQKFSSTGEYLESLTQSKPVGGITVDSHGNLVISSTPIDLDAFGNSFTVGETENGEKGVLISAAHETGLWDQGEPTGLAVDRSTDDLFSDHGTYIRLFHASTPCLIRSPCPPSDSFGSGDLTSAKGLAINPTSEILYAADAGAGDIAVFGPRPVPNLTTGPAVLQGLTSAIVHGEVDPAAAGQVENCRFEYTTDAEYRAHGYSEASSVPCSPATSFIETKEVTAELTNLIPLTSYHYRLTATASEDHEILTYGADRLFTPSSGLLPTIDATSTSSVTSTTATLSAAINPNSAATLYRFRYGTTPAYGNQTAPSESIGEASTVLPVSTEVVGLTPATVYHFQVIAVNLNGIAEGPDRSFTTPAAPLVTETSATGIGPTGATITAALRPGFRPTSYRFEYGIGTGYGHSTPQSAAFGSETDNSPHSVSTMIAGLEPNTTYHFRVVALNEVGATSGPDQNFTTAPPEEHKPAPAPTCKKNQVLKHGKCIKRSHHKKKHRNRGGKK